MTKMTSDQYGLHELQPGQRTFIPLRVFGTGSKQKAAITKARNAYAMQFHAVPLVAGDTFDGFTAPESGWVILNKGPLRYDF